MKTMILKSLAKVPTVMKGTIKELSKDKIKEAVKTELKQQAAIIPLKAQIHAEHKLKASWEASLNEYKDIPGQLVHEFKRQSFHQGQQPFMNNNTYFEQYHYRPQQQRYNSTPQPNLAEVLYNAEQNMRRYK